MPSRKTRPKLEYAHMVKHCFWCGDPVGISHMPGASILIDFVVCRACNEDPERVKEHTRRDDGQEAKDFRGA